MWHARSTPEQRFAFTDFPQVAVLGSWHKSINFGDKPLSSQEGTTHLNGFNDFRTDNGSSEGQNLALTVIFVNSLDSGPTVLQMSPVLQMSTRGRAMSGAGTKTWAQGTSASTQTLNPILEAIFASRDYSQVDVLGSRYKSVNFGRAAVGRMWHI